MTWENKMSARRCRHFHFEKPTISFLCSSTRMPSSIFTQLDGNRASKLAGTENSSIPLHPVNLVGTHRNGNWNDLLSLLYVLINCTRQPATQSRTLPTCAPDSGVAPSGRAKVHLKTVAIAWVFTPCLVFSHPGPSLTLPPCRPCGDSWILGAGAFERKKVPGRGQYRS